MALGTFNLLGGGELARLEVGNNSRSTRSSWNDGKAACGCGTLIVGVIVVVAAGSAVPIWGDSFAPLHPSDSEISHKKYSLAHFMQSS